MLKESELYIVIIIGIILGVLLVGFIVAMILAYQRRQRHQELEVQRLKDLHEREALRSQLEIQEHTMKAISQELHDNIGQMLSVVKLSLSILPIDTDHPAYEPAKGAQVVLNKAILDLSNITKSMHTDRIAHVGLVESVRFELEAIRKAGLVKVDFTQEGTEMNFEDQKAIFLFRIFQENLNNLLKHSKATEVAVKMTYTDDNFMLEIRDNGVGFNVAEKQRSSAAGSGVGLKSMFNRAQIIGAEISIDSIPGEGTKAVIKVPFFEDE
jgi:two-component system, NarL family, sensor kinase